MSFSTQAFDLQGHRGARGLLPENTLPAFEKAIELGLADDYGTLDSVARDVVKAEDIVDYTRQDNVAERLAKRFGAAFGEAVVKASLNLVPHLR